MLCDQNLARDNLNIPAALVTVMITDLGDWEVALVEEDGGSSILRVRHMVRAVVQKKVSLMDSNS